MESARRAPRCARRFLLAVEALQEREARADRGEEVPSRVAAQRPLPAMDVRVLEGGFDQWCRRFWADGRRVDAYDDEIWGYGEMGGTSLYAHDEPAHPEYRRPEDQAATPWSGAARPGSAQPPERQELQEQLLLKRPRAGDELP